MNYERGMSVAQTVQEKCVIGPIDPYIHKFHIPCLESHPGKKKNHHLAKNVVFGTTLHLPIKYIQEHISSR